MIIIRFYLALTRTEILISLILNRFNIRKKAALLIITLIILIIYLPLNIIKFSNINQNI